MESADTRVLTSWKEIAGHLDVTVRTAQLWEKQRGLPVRRMPGPRGRVYLRIDEYEAWLASADDEPNQDATDAGDGQAAKPGSTASGNSDWRLWPLVAGVAVISLLVGVVAAPRLLRGGRAVVPSSAGVPAQALVRDGILIVLNAAGDELWRKEFDRGLEQGLYDEGKLHATIADIDGDGTVEVLFPRQSADGIIADDLICYSQAGDEIWRFRPGADGLANDKQTFENVFRVAYHDRSTWVVDGG